MFGWFTTEPVNSTSKTWNFIIGCILLPCLLTLRQCHICFAQQNISVDREIPLYNRNRNFTTSPKNHLNSKKKHPKAQLRIQQASSQRPLRSHAEAAMFTVMTSGVVETPATWHLKIPGGARGEGN